MSGFPALGVVGGHGWLGGAIVQAVLEAGLVAEDELALSYRSRPSARFPGALWTPDNQALADRSQVIVLSVRPEDWPQVRFSAPDRLVVSVMAGVPLAEIAGRLGTDRVVRALPNAAAAVRASYSPWFAGPGLTSGDRGLVRALLSACGTEDEVRREADLDHLTGLSGSGPAFPALLANAMMSHAIGQGIEPAVARRAVQGVLVGAGRLAALDDAAGPTETVDSFLAYRGTTAAAIEAMRAAGFDAAVALGLAAAANRSKRIARTS